MVKLIITYFYRTNPSRIWSLTKRRRAISSTRRKWLRQSEVFESDFKLGFFIINHFYAIHTMFINEQGGEL